MNLKKIFDRAVSTYLESEVSSDDDKSSASGNGPLSTPIYSPHKSLPVSRSGAGSQSKHKHSRKLSKTSTPVGKSSGKADKKKPGKEIYDYESEEAESNVESDPPPNNHFRESKKSSSKNRSKTSGKHETSRAAKREVNYDEDQDDDDDFFEDDDHELGINFDCNTWDHSLLENLA